MSPPFFGLKGKPGNQLACNKQQTSLLEYDRDHIGKKMLLKASREAKSSSTQHRLQECEDIRLKKKRVSVGRQDRSYTSERKR
jgi:hypothetical protein